MDNGIILTVTFSIPLLLLLGYFIWSSNRKKRQAEVLKLNWEKFENALNNNHINGINKYGTAVIWNENLSDSQMKIMKESIYPLAEKYTELKPLKSLIHNKWLDWNRDYL